MRAFHEKSLALWVLKAGGTMFSILGLLALGLAVVGVYGVKSYVVSSRTREIGIRMALGADARRVRWLVLRQGLALTAAGLASGMPLAITASFVMNSVMWGFTRFDAPVILGAPAVLAAAALLASYIPARRATRIEPVRALRAG
jgi:ABC-type antimicrobial peptide transport system permease subunit